MTVSSTRAMPLAQLLAGYADAGAAGAVVVRGLTLDSRAVRTGDAFVALGSFADGGHGLRHADQARTRGAAAILFEPPATVDAPAPADAVAVPGLRDVLGAIADRFWDAPSAHLQVIGVTGTNGKTTTVQLIGEALTRAGHRVGSIGTLGVGLHGVLQPHAFTTPQAPDVHRHLAAMRAAGADHVAMEVSSHALDQGRVGGVRFAVAVFTNLTRDHLDYHGDMAAYGAAKARLFAWPDLRAAVINIDDAFGRALLGQHVSTPAPELIAVSAAGDADAVVRADNIALTPRGLQFDLWIGTSRHAVRSPLLGRFNVDNLLLVAGVLHALGWSPAAIAATLPVLPPVPGRMGRLGGDGTRPLVVIDYAHTPDALRQALQSLRAHTAGVLHCVFGCGGERDRGKRPQMAALAEQLADRVIVTDDNPRGEDGDAIVAEIMAGFADPAAVRVQRDRARAIALAIAAAGVDDVVLIAGKGHETYQEIHGERHPFDDGAVARQLLEATACAR